MNPIDRAGARGCLAMLGLGVLSLLFWFALYAVVMWAVGRS